MLWNIGCWPGLLEFLPYVFLPYVADASTADLVRNAMERYVEVALPLLPELPWQVTHNDPSPHNMFVDGNRIAFIVLDSASALDGAEALIAGYAAIVPLSPLDARMLVPLIRGRQAALFLADADYINKNVGRDGVLGSSYRLQYRRPVHFVRGEGMWLFDPEGRAYLDFYNNVPSLGHCNPEVVAAMAGRLNANSRYLESRLIDYAERLIATFPGELDRVVFTCTGSESNDLALRIAVGIATADAVLTIIQRDGILANALATGRRLCDGIEALGRKRPGILAVRGTGLFLGVDIGAEGQAASARRATALDIVNLMRDDGVLISTAGADEARLKIRPPLVCAADHVDRFLQSFETALTAVQTSL